MISTGVKKRVLDNGLTVLVKENHKAPVVGIFTYVKAGYFNEPDGLVGISHLMEHMFFKGTHRRGVGQIAAETKALGGYLNASTIYDHTLYYTVLPSKNFEKGLDIQSDALIHSAFDPAELWKETEVVIQEAKRKLDTPAAVTREKMFELAFEKHRMRRWRIGTEAGLRALTRDDFLNFHRDLYRPENIILVVVGDVEPKNAFRAIEKYYGDFEKGILQKQESPAEPAQRNFRYRQKSGDIQHSYIAFGFHTPEVFHPDSYAVEILAFVLGRGRSSRLYQHVKQRSNLVNTISAANYELRDLGMLLIEANAKPKNMEQAEVAILDQIKRLKTEPLTDEELSKARNVLDSMYTFSMDSVAGQANILATYEALGDYHYAEEYLNNLYQVTKTDVLAAANKYLNVSNCSLLEYVPKDVHIKFIPEDEKVSDYEKVLGHEILDQKHEQGDSQESPPQSFVYVPSNGLEKEVERHFLPNGMTLLVKEIHQLPLVSTGFFSRSGRIHENPEIAGITGLTLRTSLKGTRNLTAEEIALEIERLGSGIHYSNDSDYLGYSMNILSKNFVSGFEILTDIILEPTFPQEELDKEKENTLNAILQEKDDMFRYPLTLFYKAFFKDHAYGISSNGEPDVIKSLGRERLQVWHKRILDPKSLFVVVVGDVQSDRVRELIEERFNELRSANEAPVQNADIQSPVGIEENSDRRDKEQTSLALGFVGPKYSDNEYYALTVLQNALSGLGGRLFEELRGRQSLAYTVAAFLLDRLHGGSFVSYIATSPQNEQVAREGLLREFEKLAKEPISEKELTGAIQYTIGSHEIGLETNRAKMFHYAHDEIMGKGFENVHEYEQRIKNVTAEDILSAVQNYFDLENYALGIVRGKTAE